jgi:hypothetical protein
MSRNMNTLLFAGFVRAEEAADREEDVERRAQDHADGDVAEEGVPGREPPTCEEHGADLERADDGHEVDEGSCREVLDERGLAEASAKLPLRSEDLEGTEERAEDAADEETLEKIADAAEEGEAVRASAGASHDDDDCVDPKAVPIARRPGRGDAPFGHAASASQVTARERKQFDAGGFESLPLRPGIATTLPPT